ncbi:septation protein A [Camelimonas abortus]|uniref:Inner membrane-spanning protein YciB n=1 Tax=Camelimonas abortus TaxID=1017184 RepID=A0ABV7LDK6_9HYPH
MPAPARPISPLVKFVLELGPLGAFFLANARPQLFAPLPGAAAPALAPQQAGIFVATAVFMAATVAALAIHYALVRKLPLMPLVSAVVVLVFGGLTLALRDDHFIKLKPTIVNGLFGVTLLGGLACGRSLLHVALDTMIRMTDEGWRRLTLRWGVFFLVLALLNEIVWRNFSTDAWVNFKVFGIMPLTLLFALAQTPLLIRYALPEGESEPQKDSGSLIE